MTMIRDMYDRPGGGDWVPGACAKCTKTVYESLRELDETYNVWAGRCPHCGALNFLKFGAGMRGYSSGGMTLDLPSDEEAAANKLPPDTPTRGSDGRPIVQAGSLAGLMAVALLNGRKTL